MSSQKKGELTDQQNAFAMAIGRDGMRPTEAYKLTYNPKNSTSKTIVECASRVRWLPQVVAAIDEFKRQAGEEAKVTMAAHIAKLQEMRDAALSDGKWAAAVKAEELVGKASGLYVEQVHHSGAVSISVVDEFPD